MAQAISLRDMQRSDEPFLYEVYAGTRQEELEPTGWSAEQKDEFLRMQFNAQHIYYQNNFPDAEYAVIEADGHAIGRLYVHRRPDEICIVDIALLPEHRGAGIGSRLLREILAEASEVGKPVRIHVEKNNPALSLYQRLGFTINADKGFYWLMEWIPETR